MEKNNNFCTLYTAELFEQSSVVQFVHSIASLKSQHLPLGWVIVPADPEEDS